MIAIMPPKKAGADKASKKTEMKKKEKIIEVTRHIRKFKRFRKRRRGHFIHLLLLLQDKTFGLKNKKGGKNQKFIAQVEKQVKQGGDPRARRMEEMKAQEKKAREDAKRREMEEKKLLSNSVVTQKVEQGQTDQKPSSGHQDEMMNIFCFVSGVDPKSIFCAFFKQGLCKKGDKCKFSHDPAVERKSAKRNIYEQEKEEDNMEDWDEDKLNEVVAKKHGSERSNQTDIVS